MPSASARSCNVRIVPFLMLLVPGLCGCGGTGHVSGTVTKNGQVVKSGVITLISKEGKGTALASIKKDGTYTALNVPAGETAVVLVNAMEEAAFVPPPRNAAEVAKRASQPVAAKPPTVIPDKFAKPETSGLTLTVRSGDNPFDIDVGK